MSQLKKHKIKRKQDRELCKCMLTTAEKLAYGQKMADATQEIRQLNDQLAGMKKDFQARIEQREATVGLMSAALRSGYEHRETEVEIVHDWTDKTIKVIRMDTQEVIRERTMTDDERQVPLDVVEEEIEG